MRNLINIIGILFFVMLFSCNGKTKNTNETSHENSASNEFYFNFTIDGKEFHLAEEDVLTSYNDFGSGDTEFKIFAGGDKGPNLTLTIPANMAKPSTTPNGSPDPANKISQGSVSLQNYPEKRLVFNSYDFLLNPKPEVIQDAIVITNSEKVEDKGRIITGTINVIVRGGENKQNDPSIKDYEIKGKFRIMHEFKGLSF